MALISSILRKTEGGYLTWWCPGCDDAHMVSTESAQGPSWSWNGDAEKPTFAPSVLVTYRAVPDAEEEFKEWRTERRCHSFVVDGKMQMLGDSTHALAGQTVPIPPWPYPDEDYP